MEDKTEFTREPYSDRPCIKQAEIVKKISMGVGGQKDEAEEATKNLVVVRFQRNDITKFRNFVSKEYPHLDEENLYEMIKTFDVARKEGFPVPATTRLYVTSEYDPAILMTDMTQGGKYLVWGYNDNPTKKEENTLKEIELTENCMDSIKNQCKEIAKLANEKKHWLSFHNFHIRQNRKTKDVEVFLLDLDDTFLDSIYNLESKNELELKEFMELLTAKPKDRQVIIDRYNLRGR